MINYDSEFDVMYLVTGENEESIGKECFGNVILRYSIKDKSKLTGITILDFSRFLKKQTNYEKAWFELMKTSFIPDDAYKIKKIEEKYVKKGK